MNGGWILDYLVREGDTLPATGERTFKATETIRAGAPASLNIKLWEGDIESKVEDNRFIGYMKISGDDFDYGTIREGAEIICHYTINDSGNIDLELEVPSISENFNNSNFYSRQEGQIDLNNAAGTINEEGLRLLKKIKEVAPFIDEQNHEALKEAAETASEAICVRQETSDHEELQHLADDLLVAKKKLHKIRRADRSHIRKTLYDWLWEVYLNERAQKALPEENARYKKLFAAAQNSIERDDSSFDNIIEAIRILNGNVAKRNLPDLMRWFASLVRAPSDYSDRAAFERFKAEGQAAVEREDAQQILAAIDNLYAIKIDDDKEGMMANIVQG